MIKKYRLCRANVCYFRPVNSVHAQHSVVVCPTAKTGPGVKTEEDNSVVENIIK